MIAVIGYIIGIIMGLYFKFSIVLLYIPIIAVYLVIKKIHIIQGYAVTKKKLKLVSVKRYLRYLKLIVNSKMIFCIIIFSIISNSIVIFQNQKYESYYKDGEEIKVEAIVISDAQEKEYNYVYKIKILCADNNDKYKNTYLYLKTSKKSTEKLKYGDKIEVKGSFTEASSQRNYGGFNYKEYLKSLKMYGTIKANQLKVLSGDCLNNIFNLANQVSSMMKQKIDSSMEETQAAIIKGIIFGDSSDIEEEMQENFRISSISHVLAVSGMHVSYLVIGIQLFLKSIIGKRKIRFITIVFLIFYMFITGFSPSVVRASMMSILLIGGEILYRKNDIWTSMAISLFLILIYNPFLIENIGLQFSYIGTMGIMILHKSVFSFLKNIKIKNKKWKYKFNRKAIFFISKIKEILAVTLSAQLAIFPIMIYHFNLFGVYFLISNLLVSVMIGPIIIFSTIFIVFSFIFNPISKVICIVLKLLIQMLIIISNLAELPFSKLYLSTPKIWMILLYYILIITFNFIYCLYTSPKLNNTQVRVRNLIALAKYKIFLNKKKSIIKIFIIILLFFLFQFIPKNLEINFVDVGQGDCTFIVTPRNKTILIDGGGSSSDEFDVGKSTLLPYILDKGYTKIDYIFISHFDQDHVGGILTILQEIKVKKVIISKQEENSENYQKFLEIIKEKGVSVAIVKMGDRVKIENGIYFDILWPTSEQIQENKLNNNSLVMKMYYHNFSVLFTGDIEKEAEKKILETYKSEKNKLVSNVLKVAHHGSKTSTIKEFLDTVNPQIALIGVGKNNMFHHPSEEIIDKLKEYRAIIYRTDERGEITIRVNGKGNFKIKSIN